MDTISALLTAVQIYFENIIREREKVGDGWGWVDLGAGAEGE